jgi:hypothetical protein
VRRQDALHVPAAQHELVAADPVRLQAREQLVGVDVSSGRS